MVPSIVGLAQWNWSELTKVVNIGEVKANTANANPIFRGKVSVQKITGESSDEFRIIAVNFSLEAVNAFHTHTFDQVPYITDGNWIVATETEEVVVTSGTFIYIPAGENHWHGATGDSAFSHIAIMPLRETSF